MCDIHQKYGTSTNCTLSNNTARTEEKKGNLLWGADTVNSKLYYASQNTRRQVNMHVLVNLFTQSENYMQHILISVNQVPKG